MKPSNYLYCKQCNRDIHPNNTIQSAERVTETECLNPYEGYLDSYKYRDVVKVYLVYRCPVCNSVLKRIS